MLKGLVETCETLEKLNIPFVLLSGQPEENLDKFINDNSISLLITDFDPLKIKREWQERLLNKIKVPFYEVDSHNIVPCRMVSLKEEFAAYTIRPRINSLLPEFLVEFPKLKYFSNNERKEVQQFASESKRLLQNKLLKLKYNYSFESGEENSLEMLRYFIDNKLNSYNEFKNKPDMDATSNLSPYIHFGQISSQRIALEILKTDISEDLKSSFLDELVVRKELADNFCFYNKDYDNFDGLRKWAKDTLNEHRKDQRFILYTTEQLELAQTHDELWNTAQNEMVVTGKMHGYMRMYWAKKILEWSENPETAFETAIYLNDKYELDGRDPNGYAGIAWSIGGMHDRAWNERPIFGKIRYMSYNSQIKKLNLAKYKMRINEYYNK